MDSHQYFAGGAALGIDYNLFRSFAVGLSAAASAKSTGFAAIEPAAMFRWYFWGKNHTGFFAQADAGVFIYMENEQPIPLFLGGARAGYRLPLGRMFYVEPYARGGYPFAFGIGVNAGIRLPDRKQPERAAVIPAETPENIIVETGKYYIVRRGDTLSRIAVSEYGNGYWWPMIAAANPGIPNPHLIYPGQRLYIPPRAEATAELTEPTTAPVPGRYYVVRRGDTLSRIAVSAYGDAHRWPEIAAANPYPYLMYPDQLLYIPK
jgi:LysM repeat protein